VLKRNINNEFKHYRSHIKQNQAVSELVGAFFLLSIVVSSFCVIFYNVLSIPPTSDPNPEDYEAIINLIPL